MHIMFNTGITAASYLHQNGPLLEARRKENADNFQCLWLFWWIGQKQVACICRDVLWLDEGPHTSLMMTSSLGLIAFLPLLFCVTFSQGPGPPTVFLRPDLPHPRTQHASPNCPSPGHLLISCLQQVSKLWFFQYSCIDVRVGL